MRKIKESELPVLCAAGNRAYTYLCNANIHCGKIMIGDSGYCLPHLNSELKRLNIAEIKQDARGDLWWASSIDEVSDKLLGIEDNQQKVNSLSLQPVTPTRWQRIGLFLLQKLFGLHIAVLKESVEIVEESKRKPRSLTESGLFD